MKICNVSMFYHPRKGGQESYIEDLIQVFNKNNIKSTVLQPKNNHPKKEGVIFPPVSFPFKNKISNIFTRFNWFAFNWELLFCKKTLQKQDVIISHYSFHYPSLKKYRKLVILSHGVLWDKPPKSVFDKVFVNSNQNIVKNNVFVVANDTEFIRELGYNTQPKEKLFEEVRENIWFIPNCVDTYFFTRKPEIRKEKVIIVPRNIRRNRGIHLAIKSFAIFNKKNPGFELQIVGKGASGEYFEYCKKLAKDLGIDKQIEFVGHLNRDEMVNYFNKATITLIPTIEKEGTSLSALESMSCGTPTIVTKIGGLKDLPAIQAELSPEDISKKLIFTLENIEKISKKQQSITQTTFNLRNWGEAWLNVINKIYEK